MTISAEGLELDVLLSESIGAVRAREASAFDELRSNLSTPVEYSPVSAG